MTSPTPLSTGTPDHAIGTLTGDGPGSLSRALDFDHVIRLDADLTLTEHPTRTHRVNMTGAGTPPFCNCGWVNNQRTGPILADHLRENAVPSAPEALDPDGNSTQLEGWELITAGLTGQQGYRGPWLHDSEIIAGGVAHRVIEHAQENGGGYYVAIYGQYTREHDHDQTPADYACLACEDGDTIIEGWAIAYKAVTA